ncbi:hypothetical protein YC2023_024755 [Brassica napus]
MISGNWDPGIGTSLWFNSEATGYDSDGWKVEFYSIQTGFDLELKKGISGSLRKIKIGSEWRMISTIINTESQLYEGYISEYAYLLFISSKLLGNGEEMKNGEGTRKRLKIVSFFNAISVACGQWRVIMENGKAWRVHGYGPWKFETGTR